MADRSYRSVRCFGIVEKWTNTCATSRISSIFFQPSWMAPILAIYRYYYRTVLRIRSRVKQLCDIAPAQPYPQTMSEITSLVQAAQNLDLHLERWRQENPTFESGECAPSDTIRSHKLPSALSQSYFSHPKVAMFRRRLGLYAIQAS